MTPLKQKFIEDMQLRALANKTQTAYLNAVRDLVAHFQKSQILHAIVESG